jgi:hypothetical protein
MADFDELAHRYIAAWNETDPAERSRLVRDLWAEDARYVDPLVVADGRDAIDATIGAVQQRFPGFAFRLVGAVDGHHDQARFAWEFGPAQGGGLAPVAGFDVAIVGGDGHLQTVLGFLDRVPAA